VKRSLSWWLVAFLIFTCVSLAACGGGTKESGSNPQGEEDAAVESSGNEGDTLSLGALFAKSENVEGMTYDFTLQSKKQEMSGKFWMQGDKFKFESMMEGQKVITIFDGSTVYNCIPDQNMAVKVAMDAISQPETPLEKAESFEEGNAKLLETTVYDGVKCKVVSISGPDGQEEAKMWVREDYGIPVKVEVTEADGSKTVMEYKNLEIGPPPAGTFELPSGIEVMDMSNMIEQMPDMSQLPGN